MRVLDLNDVVSRVHSLLRRLIGEDIDLTLRLAQSLDRVDVDPGQIEQIIVNLAVNARDAMPLGGRLTIETGTADLDAAGFGRHDDVPAGRYVKLAVADTGVGIPEERRPHIFEPFYTTKERGKGTGLGLATVYGIVRQRGAIGVDSTVGRGTSFTVYLPAVAAAPDEPARECDARARGGGETILIAEDQAEVRLVMQKVLGRYGYTVLAATGGQEALQIARDFEQPIDLLLTDVVMPAMSGRDLVEQLHEVRPAVRVLYASGYTDDGVVRSGVFESGTAFLQKPFSPEDLLTKVREVLDQPVAT